MSDSQHAEAPGPSTDGPDQSRRGFVAASMAAGCLPASAALRGHAPMPLPVALQEVVVPTSHGACDATLFHPEQGAHPGVVFWTDVFGLRPAMCAMAQRLASHGYAVIVPNPYYRIHRAPFFVTATHFDFKVQANRDHLGSLVASIRAPGAVEGDAAALVAFLDRLPQVDRGRKVGTVGYCSGGPLVVRSAAAVPARIGAGAVFHGGALVTKQPDSPHLLAPRIRAHMYFGISFDDDEKYPYDRHRIHESFMQAHLPVQVDVYRGRHGWCVPDLPMGDDGPYYDPAEAERAWTALVRLFHRALHEGVPV